MEIIVTKGRGEAPTELAAFDKALLDAGVANYNLVKLSSVIPPKSKIRVKKINLSGRKKDYGKKLFCVYSVNYAVRKGESAWVGVGWVQKKDGRGLFVEHKGRSEKEVRKLIKDSLNFMVRARKEHYGEINYELEGIKYSGRPAAAIAVAVYKVESW